MESIYGYDAGLGQKNKFGFMININIRVIPRAKKNLVKIEPGRLKVYLTAPPQDGKANKLLIAVLAEHFKVKKKQVCILRGEKSQDKIIEIIKQGE